MAETLFVPTPLDDYTLVDFGGGRRLERFGRYLVERPDPRAGGVPARTGWEPDWRFQPRAAGGQWLPRFPDLPRRWSVRVGGQQFEIRLGDGPAVGLEPEQIPCWQWVRERLAGCYHLPELRVLNLFAGSGGATGAALREGAEVWHVEAAAEVLRRAREALGEAQVKWVHAEAQAFVDQALRGGAAFQLLVVRPPARQRGPRGRAWDISCDLAPLMAKLPRLTGQDCRGVWFAPREAEWGRPWPAETLERLLHDYFPGRPVYTLDLGLTTADGRVLRTGAAACWVDEGAAEGVDLPPLSAAELEERLDVHLDAILSSRRTAAGPAGRLAARSRREQEFGLRWVEVVARTNAEFAFQFADRVARAFECLEEEAAVEEWLLQAMDAYDRAGLHAAIGVLGELEDFAARMRDRDTEVSFDEVAHTLELFVQGLAGRRLKLEAADRCYTDTETLFLPHSLKRLPGRRQNFLLYKALAARLWAQTWFGTFRTDLAARIAALPEPGRALAHLRVLEGVRLEAAIARELPGLGREMAELCAGLGGAPALPGAWVRRLQSPAATVEDSLDLLRQCRGMPPEAPCLLPLIDPAAAARVQAARVEREREALGVMLARMVEEGAPPDREAGPGEEAATPEIAIELPERPGADLRVTIDGVPRSPPAEARALIGSIVQDFGEIPPDYLVAAGPGGYKHDPRGEAEAGGVWSGTYHEEGALLYNEWDCRRAHYRKDWCVLREKDVPPGDPGFVDEALSRHAGLVRQIRRTFEILRGEERLLRRQPHGDDVDIDALVETLADARRGLEMSERLFLRRQKVERDIAVMFMVDMSGSTKGWINQAEREALVLLCEALEQLGDRYAIYGFSGTTRKRCEVFRIKRFDEPYAESVRARIAGIEPQDYTRMGVAIRHLCGQLGEVEARTRMLVTLSDGKPDDFDGYRGEYGIEDTRMALLEARREGIHPYCITIDEEARDYLPHMYGAASFSVIDDVRRLPVKVQDIYRRLTT